MKRPYEIPVVFRIMSDDDFKQAVDQVVAWIEKSTELDLEQAGSVTKIDRTRFGRRRLAYEIDGQRDAWYIIFYADIEPTHLPELELNLKLYDPVLRYLVIKDDSAKQAKSAKAASSEPVTEVVAEPGDASADDLGETPADTSAEEPAE